MLREAVDLNCDMGEGMSTDAAIFPFISSSNIACGGHAGDADTMRRTVELALRHGVAIGAHPSYPDRVNFGRIDILDRPLRRVDLPGLIYEQLHRLQSICREFGTRMRHVKPHGALYNRAARDADVSALIVRAVVDLDPSLLLFGLSGGETQQIAGESGLRFISEVFADRTYQPDGSLTPRSEPGALIEDPARAVAQVLRMVQEGRVETVGGSRSAAGDGRARSGGEERAGDGRAGEPGEDTVAIRAETICLHGDGSHAVEFAGLIHGALTGKGIRIAAPGR